MADSVRRSRQMARSEASTAKALQAALELFSSQGFRATTMRQIASEAGVSVGNLYHHFAGKEEIFERLLEDYWKRFEDPDLALTRVFSAAGFPEDMEEMASAIREVVERNRAYILLIYVDVIEFQGRHIHGFYERMAGYFREVYGEKLEERKRRGDFGDVDPLVAVMVAARWFFYFYTVEKCFGVPMHFGMGPEEAVGEFIRLLRYGLEPRSEPIDQGKKAISAGMGG